MLQTINIFYLYCIAENVSMEQLIIQSQLKIAKITTDFQRYLIKEINWNDRLISIRGARGVGKTTLLLQHIFNSRLANNSYLYVSMDDLYFINTTLIDLARSFSNIGGKHLFLDEVHKYPNWSREIKLIYDNHPELYVVFTSSSILEIYKAESDLSRRAISYDLKELSFREYIELKHKIKFDKYSFKEIIDNHQSISLGIQSKIKPIQFFREYVRFGAYPFFIENEDNYHQRLRNVISMVIDIDINAVENLSYDVLTKIKRLLSAVATSVPFTPNITRLSEKLNISRPTLLQALQILERARITSSINKVAKGIGVLTKPEKLYLNNTNLLFALVGTQVDSGTVRETFFMNQLNGIVKLNIPEKGDFLLNEEYIMEVGGRSKKQKQLIRIEKGYIVKDDIEIGANNIIPLWLFGFLY